MRKFITALAACLLSLSAGSTIYVEDSGTVRQVVRLTVEDSGTVRQIQRVYVEDSGMVRLVFSTMSVAKSGDASGSCDRSGPGNCTATTNSVTCIVTGAVGPVTYSWTSISGTSATANSPTSATTTFFRNDHTSPGYYSGVMRCTATDTGSGLTGTADVTVVTTHLES